MSCQLQLQFIWKSEVKIGTHCLNCFVIHGDNSVRCWQDVGIDCVGELHGSKFHIGHPDSCALQVKSSSQLHQGCVKYRMAIKCATNFMSQRLYMPSNLFLLLYLSNFLP